MSLQDQYMNSESACQTRQWVTHSVIGFFVKSWLLLIVCIVIGLALNHVSSSDELLAVTSHHNDCFGIPCGEPQLSPAAIPLTSDFHRALNEIVRFDGSSSPSALELYHLTLNGEGASAVQRLANAARVLGYWGPAPGDAVVYDPSLPRNVRGAVSVADTLPVECDNQSLRSFNPWPDRFTPHCQSDLLQGENLVRLGRAAFLNPTKDGNATPRPSFDDLLATYIEEVGHSWQEYLYETEGRESGPRTRSTTWEETVRLVPGREYQVKRYLLYLDGRLLALSEEQRTELQAAICDFRGYANPLGHPFPVFGPPVGWPYPEGWPTTAPTREDVATFCTSVGSVLWSETISER